MILHIKNMVCDRCILVVRQQLELLGLQVTNVSLGTAEVSPDSDARQKERIASSLKLLGFELIDQEKDKIVEQIKNTVISLVHHSDEEELHVNFPQALSNALHRDYAWISRQFSESADLTLEKFIIQQKIEKVKELLQYGELNLNEIAYKMGYSSSAHLSNQFKAVTGLSPREFVRTGGERKALDKIIR
jgi:YesN/AraC family two-component response regulator